MFYTYRHIRLDTGTPFYVGKGSNNRAFEKRGRNKYWKNIVKSKGYRVEIIQDNMNEEDAFAFEEKLIKLYKSLGYCEANLTDGGEGLKGFTPWNKGTTVSESMKKQISNKLKGIIPSIETRNKISKANKGKIRTPEVVEKLRKIGKERGSPMQGRKCSDSHKNKISNKIKGLKRSEETKDKIALSNSKGSFKVLDYNENLIGIWHNQAKCSRDLKIPRTTISACIHGRMKSFNGYKFILIPTN